MAKILVTGGAGFVGSHIVERVVEAYPSTTVTVFDKMTYAADYSNIRHLIDAGRVELVVGDVCDLQLCKRLTRSTDVVVHAAAESHVDNSFGNSLLFTRSNVLGTHSIMEACRVNGVPTIIHVSTDEVYGEVLEGASTEETLLRPTNPYSASKAAAEMIIQGYVSSYGLPVIQVRANNIFGIRQFPEKIIPRSCICLIAGLRIPIHGTGEYCRHYLSAQDFSEAITLLIEKGTPGQVYNVGSEEEYTNLQVVGLICRAFKRNLQTEIQFVKDRPFNDRRYSISSEKISMLGWRPRRTLSSQIEDLALWYQENSDRYLSGPYFDMIVGHRNTQDSMSPELADIGV